MWGPRAVVLAALAVISSACAATRPLHPGMLVEVLTPVDRVPVRDTGVWSDDGTECESARERILLDLRAAVADGLAERGVQVCEDQLEAPAGRPDAAALAARARTDGVDAVVLPELVAYGQVRRSWLWVLLGQGLAAGVGHGVAAAKVTGKPSDGWIVGGGEFLLETVTWVGGAFVASRVIDPVIIRVWVVPAGPSSVVRRTGEGLRPLGHWLRRGEPRPGRVAAVARRVLSRLAGKLVARPSGAAARRAPAPRPAPP